MKLNVLLSYDPGITILSIHPRKTISQKLIEHAYAHTYLKRQKEHWYSSIKEQQKIRQANYYLFM